MLGKRTANGQRATSLVVAGVCILVLLTLSITFYPAASRCNARGRGWLCLSSNAHACDIAPLTCFTVPSSLTQPSSAKELEGQAARVPVTTPLVPMNQILRDIHSNSWEGANEWHIGNEYRRSEWLAQLRLMDGSAQAARYDSNRDEWRVWAHAPFYPIWTCPFSLRLGNIADGGKWVCLPNKLSTDTNKCIVYSFGSNGDFSFESSILQQNEECEIHTFDPSNYGDLAPKDVNYHAMALTGDLQRMSTIKSSSSHLLSANSKTIAEIRTMLGHQGKRVAILKMDIEWSEYYFLDDYFRSGDMWADQILLEIHLPMTQSYTLLANIFRNMDANGYRLFAKEHNIDCTVCHEFAWYRVTDTSKPVKNKRISRNTNTKTDTNGHK